MKGFNFNPSADNCGGSRLESNPDSGSNSTLNIKVSYNGGEYPVSLPHGSTFGYLKSVFVQKLGLNLNPERHKVLFRGKEKADDEDLQTAGVKNGSKVLIMEDTPRESSEPVKEASVVSMGDKDVALVRVEVDKLADQVAALKSVVEGKNTIDDKHVVYLTEMLMRQLLKLDGIQVEGEARARRKLEVQRIQHLVDAMDELRSINMDPAPPSAPLSTPVTAPPTLNPYSSPSPDPMPSTAPYVGYPAFDPYSTPNVGPVFAAEYQNLTPYPPLQYYMPHASSMPNLYSTHLPHPSPSLTSFNPSLVYPYLVQSAHSAFVPPSQDASSVQSDPPPVPSSSKITEKWESFD